MLPGRTTLDHGRGALAGHWPTVPATRGLDATGILRAAAAGELDVLVLLGSDPLCDHPDRTLAQAALAQVPHVVALDRFVTESVTHADVILPVAGLAESEGTTTNVEGRVSRLKQSVTPPGTARPDWMIGVDLAWLLGHDLGLDTAEQIRAEMVALAPSWSGFSEELLDAAVDDGLVLPVAVPADPADADAADPDDAEDGAEAGTGSGTLDAADMDAPPAETAAAEAEGEEAASDGPATVQLGKGGPAAVAPAPARSPLLDALAAAEPPAPPKNDAYSFRLIASRKLYDDGVLVRSSPLLAGLPPGTDVRISPYDFDRLGVAAGTEVYLTSSRTTLQAPLHPDPGVPRGAAAVFVGQPDLAVRDLIDCSAPIVEVRIDTEEPR
jgi:NADH-quinone oxidoreductase subunit G